MFNQVTYNVLIERFKAYAQGHYKIERFSHGQIDVTDIDKEQRFPWMHVVPVSIAPNSGTRSFTLDVVFADMPRDKENKTEYQRESLSDCIQLAEDLLAEIKNGGVIFGEDVTLEEGSAVQPFMEEYTHVLTGVTLSLTMTFPWNWSACDIPADWTTGGTSGGGSGGSGGALVLRVNSVDNAIQNILNLVDGTNTTIQDLGDGRVRVNSSGGITSVSWGDIIGNIADQLDLALWFNDKADVASLAEVAFTGDYADLINAPTIPSLVATTWDANHAALTGNPYTKGDVVWYGGQVYACIATNDGIVPTNATYWTLLGNGNRLRETPVDWNAVSGDFQILNKPAIPDASTFVPYTGAASNINIGENKLASEDANGSSTVAPSYMNVQNTAGTKYALIEQTGVTVVDDAAGDTMSIAAGQITFPDSTSQYTAAVNADWNSTSGLSEILNKPAVIGDMTKAVYDTDADGVVDAAERIEIVVRNSTGAPLLKGQIVYLSGATGNRPNAILADASTEATSSKTIGFVIATIANNADGSVAVNGTLHDLDTSAFAAGDTLWLSETAGAWQANTPPVEPAHAVFLGYVARSHPNLGRVVIQVQNGYELNELHGVQITSETDKDALMFNAATGLWKNKQIVAADISDATDVGKNILTLTNPAAISYLRINADNSISAVTLAEMRAALGLITQIQSTQLTNSSTTSSVNITGCAISLEANSTYVGRMTIASGSVPVLGFSLLFTYPNGITALAGRTSSSSAITAQVMQWHTLSSGTPFTPLLGTAQNQIGYAVIDLYIATTANAGTFMPAFRSASTGSAITIYAGLTNITLQKL